MKVVEKAGNYIQLFVMTSEKNHDATVGFSRSMTISVMIRTILLFQAGHGSGCRL